MTENLNLDIKNGVNEEKLDSIIDKFTPYDDELEKMFNLGKKKKKIKEKKNEIQDLVSERSNINYSYKELLDNLYKDIGDLFQNTNKKQIIPQPIINKLSITKIVWINFNETCLFLNRNFNHLLLFVISEFHTQATINENKQLIIKGKYNSKNIENLLRKYVCVYVQCNLCRSNNTIINKDNINRIQNLECLICKAVKSIPLIK